VVGAVSRERPYAAQLDGSGWRLLDALPMRAALTSVSGGPDGSLWIAEAAPGGLWRRPAGGRWGRVSFAAIAPASGDKAKVGFTPKHVRVLPSGAAWVVGCFGSETCGAVYVGPVS
jgi:hypothetical protein